MRTIDEALQEAKRHAGGVYEDLLRYDAGGDGQTDTLLLSAANKLHALGVAQEEALIWLTEKYERKYESGKVPVERAISKSNYSFVIPLDENGEFCFDTEKYGSINDRGKVRSKVSRAFRASDEDIGVNINTATAREIDIAKYNAPINKSVSSILSELYAKGDLVCVGKDVRGAVTATLAEHRDDLDEYQYIVPNRMSKKWGVNKCGKRSVRCEDSAASKPEWLVMEIDRRVPKDGQKHVMAFLSQVLPLCMIVDSGNKSLHAWFKSPPTRRQIRKAKELLISHGADPRCLDEWQWVRMPNGRRDNGKKQQVQYFHPKAKKRRIEPSKLDAYWRKYVKKDPQFEVLCGRNADIKCDPEGEIAGDENVDGGFVLPKPHTYMDLQREHAKPLQAVISNVVSVGEKLMVAASSKAGKTWILLRLAKAVSEGMPWFNFETNKGRVLYLNFELSNARMRERISKIGGFSDDVDIITFRGMLVNWLDLKESLSKLEGSYSLIVLDPIYKMLGGINENDNGEVAELLHHVEMIAARMNAAIAYAHHFSKGNKSYQSQIDRASGAGSWARDPDALITFTEHEEHGYYTMESSLRNYRAPGASVWKYEFPNFIHQPHLDPEALKGRRGGSNSKKGVSRECIKKALEGCPDGMTRAELKDHLERSGVSKTTAYEHINKALIEGLIEERDGALQLLQEEPLT